MKKKKIYIYFSPSTPINHQTTSEIYLGLCDQLKYLTEYEALHHPKKLQQ